MIYTRTYRSKGRIRLIRLYRVFTNMHQRCANKRYHGWKNYGGRGISVCDAWALFGPFREWAISAGYGLGLSIDRCDNDGDYSPNNCRWASPIVQANNKQRKRNGKPNNGDGRPRVLGVGHGNALPENVVAGVYLATGSHSEIARRFGIGPAAVGTIKRKERHRVTTDRLDAQLLHGEGKGNNSVMAGDGVNGG